MNQFLKKDGEDFEYPKQWQDGNIPSFPYGMYTPIKQLCILVPVTPFLHQLPAVVQKIYFFGAIWENLHYIW